MLKLYNSLTRKIEVFKPLHGQRVGLYTCGPTVYNYAHLGNLRTYLFEDILKRVLVYNGYKVKQVMNITDVGHLASDADEGEDKMLAAARAEGKTAWDIASFYTKVFKKDLAALNILKPSVFCRATDYIKEQIALVKILAKKGFTYQTSDGLYFDTGKLRDYGKLTGQRLNDKEAGARVAVNPEKKQAWDFALWKFSPPADAGPKRQMEWPSPWGVGFPGWHLECSAMSRQLLGQPFDIHCGGVDHIPIHHTNEIAQSEAAFDKPLANYWLHGEFLLGDEAEKMAKSSGTIITLEALQAKGFNPLAFRYLTLNTHYRQKLNFSWEALEAAQKALDKLYDEARGWEKPKIGCAELEQKFLQAINNDLNMPQALSIVWETVKSDYPAPAKAETLLKFDQVLGLNLKKYLGQRPKIPAAARKLIKKRDQARQKKDWVLSDQLRKEIAGLGYMIRDLPDGGSEIVTVSN